MIKLITEHKDYWLLVDEAVTTGELLKHPEWWVYRRDNTVQKHGKDREGFFCDKILAYLPKHTTWPEGMQSPLLEGVPLLPKLPKQEEDVEQLASDASIKAYSDPVSPVGMNRRTGYKEGFIKGYKVASQKKWSDEDMIDMFAAGFHYEPRKIKALDDAAKEELETFKSPSASPVDFIPEYIHAPISPNGNIIATNKPYPFEGLISNFTIKSSLKIVNGVVQGRWIWQ